MSLNKGRELVDIGGRDRTEPEEVEKRFIRAVTKWAQEVGASNDIFYRNSIVVLFEPKFLHFLPNF